jgi:hypothetical protein
MRAVEFNQALGGMEGAQLPPLPPAPPNPAHTVPLPCSAQHQHQKGDISNSLTMGTFLNSFDTEHSRVLTAVAHKPSIVIEQATSSYSFRFPELSQPI